MVVLWYRVSQGWLSILYKDGRSISVNCEGNTIISSSGSPIRSILNILRIFSLRNAPYTKVKMSPVGWLCNLEPSLAQPIDYLRYIWLQHAPFSSFLFTLLSLVLTMKSSTEQLQMAQQPRHGDLCTRSLPNNAITFYARAVPKNGLNLGLLRIRPSG